MHRLLRAAIDYLRDLGRSAGRGWDRFFFAPADPTPLGLMRIALGGLLVWDLAVLGLDLRDFLGSDGWIGPEAVRQYLDEQMPWAWSFWLRVPDGGLRAAWAASLVVAALFTVGFASRVTAVLAWAVAISTVRRAPVALFGFDQMLSTWLLYLMAFGASGQALSLDRHLQRRGLGGAGWARWIWGGRLPKADGPPAATVTANLSLRLLQLHLALVYGSAGLSKLMAPEWWEGRALEMIILTPEFRRFNLAWLAAFPSLLQLATHAGLLLEIVYPVLIWVRKLRPLLFLGVVSMHFGIDLALGLTEFGLAMIAANLAFIPGPWLRNLVRPAPEGGPPDASRTATRADRHQPSNRYARLRP